MVKFYFCFLLVISLFSCHCHGGNTNEVNKGIPFAEDTISFNVFGELFNKEVEIIHDVDLQGKKCVIPEDVLLIFKGGIVKNGTLEGRMTKIQYSGACFHRVRITGTWDVSNISSTMFDDLSYDNALKDVVALSNPKVKNEIRIAKGKYQVTALEGEEKCLSFNSCTDVIFDGEIILTPNNLVGYSIFYAEGENIRISGRGLIAGDKHSHTGKEGEWGMGVRLYNAVNTSVKGLTIKDCWGDCIYIGGKSRNIEINKCVLEHGRRQGISVTQAVDVTIKNCMITKVGGTAPQYAIDIEPNKHCAVNNVLIEGVEVKDCKGGFLVTRGKKYARTAIGKVQIKKCNVSVEGRYPIRVKNCESLLIDGCILYGSNIKPGIEVEGVSKANVTNNSIYIKEKLLPSIRNVSKVMEQYSAINITNCGQKKVTGNHIYKR